MKMGCKLFGLGTVRNASFESVGWEVMIVCVYGWGSKEGDCKELKYFLYLRYQSVKAGKVVFVVLRCKWF